MKPQAAKLFPARRLHAALRRGLAVAGIDASVEIERVRSLRLYRVLVKSPDFDPLSITERQDLVWRIVRQSFTADEQLNISVILTLTPGELNGNQRG